MLFSVLGQSFLLSQVPSQQASVSACSDRVLIIREKLKVIDASLVFLHMRMHFSRLEFPYSQFTIFSSRHHKPNIRGHLDSSHFSFVSIVNLPLKMALSVVKG
jgi:hypothetical protein